MAISSFWAFYRFRPKMNFHCCFIFRFRSKNVICFGPKMLCSQLNRNNSTGDFRFRFSAEKGISFSSAFSFTAENERCIFGRPTSNCFRLHPTPMTVCLELIRRKYGSNVSIKQDQWSDSVSPTIHSWCCDTYNYTYNYNYCYIQQQFWMK